MGQTLTAAWIFLLTMQILTILYLVSRPDETFLPNLRGASPLMVIPILAAGVIIGPRYSFIFAGLSTASTIVIGLSRAKPGLLFLETPADVLDQLAVAICMFFVMASLAWFFETNFRSLIARLTYQNQTLILTNEELARKQEVEQQVAFQVNNLSKQVSKDFEEQNQQTNQQISAVLKAADTVEELGHSNQTILVAAQQVDNTARQALEVVEEGATSLQTGLQSLEILNVQATNLALALNSLYQRAYQIDQIVVLIESITETTHLLALNATIEAAGAGEFGRRFSVVAKEVQNLANQSRQALDQVHRVVGEVRQAITDSTALSQESLKETANLTGGTRSMQTVLKEIVSRVETTAYLAREISLVLEQQRGATLGVVKSMHHISDISNSLKKNTQHLVQSVSHLNEAVTHLSIVSN
jgi:methyl-accepting chemotaxis protein